MSEETIITCDECGSEFLKATSKMAHLCPECSHILYGYPNCNHVFKNGKCIHCYWNGKRSTYIKGIMNAYIPKPCNQEIEKYLNAWNSNEKYLLQESSLNKIFIETFPNNTKMEDILIKASVLNNFYSTNIFSIFPIAKHILSLDIDERLEQGDPTLISEIANVEVNGKKKRFYSFATKYCSHHNQEDFPIYDSYVDKVLMYFKKADKFANFKQSELKDYPRYKDILLEFKQFYGITSYSLKDLDMYLWQLGKEIIELKSIMKKFAASGLDLISVPAQQWLDENSDKDTLIAAIKRADKECGNCGCDLDPLYKRALELIK